MAGQTGDLATTWLGLRAGIAEDNPVVRAALAHGDFVLFGAVKLALLAALLLLALRSRRRLTWRGLQVVALAFLVVSALNAAGLAARLV